MADNTSDDIYDFEISGEMRQIQMIDSVHIDDGVDGDVYAFVGDDTQVLSIVKVKKGGRSPLEKVLSGTKTIEGFIRGKGTLTVHLENGTNNTYYFEKEGYNKEVEIKIGESVQWVAPHDSDLVYFKVRDLPKKVAPVEAAKPETTRNLKLVLTSSPLSASQAQELVKLVNKPRHSIRMALFENAAEMETDQAAVIDANRKALQSHEFNIEVVDLRQFEGKRVELFEVLKLKDVFWLGDGNVFYLHWLLLATKTNEILDYLIGQGAVYGGNGAGAIMAGPTLKHFQTTHDQNVVPEIGSTGLHLTENVVIPHFDNSKSAELVHTIQKELEHEHYKTVPLQDGQALIIDGKTERII